jgi:hypothetical protein
VYIPTLAVLIPDISLQEQVPSAFAGVLAMQRKSHYEGVVTSSYEVGSPNNQLLESLASKLREAHAGSLTSSDLRNRW